MAQHTGRCMCGAVRFSAAKLGGFGVCHCKMCQRWNGAAHFGVTVAEADMQVEGAAHIASVRSSPWASRYWCAKCGSGLWTRNDQGQHGTGDFEVGIGLLDDPNGLDLRREIFVDRKPDSYALAGAHERLTEAETLALFGISTEGGMT